MACALNVENHLIETAVYVFHAIASEKPTIERLTKHYRKSAFVHVAEKTNSMEMKNGALNVRQRKASIE